MTDNGEKKRKNRYNYDNCKLNYVTRRLKLLAGVPDIFSHCNQSRHWTSIESSILTGPLCCVAGQDTVLSQRLCPPVQEYKWVPGPVITVQHDYMLGGNMRWTSIPFKGVAILLVASPTKTVYNITYHTFSPEPNTSRSACMSIQNNLVSFAFNKVTLAFITCSCRSLSLLLLLKVILPLEPISILY